MLEAKLHNVKVLITRQAKFSASLMLQLQAYGAISTCLPLFAIQSSLNPQLIQKITDKLRCCQLAIVVSRNAAEIILPHIVPNANLQWACIGPATAEYLQRHAGLQVIYPQHAPYDSRSLIQALKKSNLKLPACNIIVFTGADGDAWLGDELLRLGAVAEQIAVYKRVTPHIISEQLQKLFKPVSVDIILITCVTSLENLVNLTAKLEVEIFSIPLLVISQRIYKHAIEMGFLKVYTTQSMLEADILSALCYWHDRQEG